MTPDRKVFLATWKEIPPTNEVQSSVVVSNNNADAIQSTLENSNVFTVARRQVEVGDSTQVIYASKLALMHIMPVDKQRTIFLTNISPFF